MLEKLTPKFTPIFKDDAEKKILDRISTRKKAEEWSEELHEARKKIWSMDYKSERAYEGKFDQIKIAICRFAINEERARIAEELSKRSKSIQSDLDSKSKALQSAKAAETKAGEKLAGFESRMAAQQSELTAKLEKAKAAEQAAQAEFDRVLLEGGDDAAEMAAAEKLASAKSVVAAVASADGAISLRIQALNREKDAASESLMVATLVKNKANMAHLEANAAAAMLVYEKTILPLIDGWVRANAALQEVRDFACSFAHDVEWVSPYREFHRKFDHPVHLPVGDVEFRLGRIGRAEGYHHSDALMLNTESDVYKAYRGPNLAILAEPLPEPEYEDIGDRIEAENANSRIQNKQEKPGDRELWNEYFQHTHAFPNKPFHSKLLTKVE